MDIKDLFLLTKMILHNPNCVNLEIRRFYEAHNANEIIDAKRAHREPVIIPHFSCYVLRHTFAQDFVRVI